MPKSSSKTKETKAAICVHDLTVRYGDNIAVDDVSFDIEKGTAAVLIGPNGSGKTTVIRSILGLTKIAGGDIDIFGSSLEKVRGRVGYVPQRFNFDKTFPITVKEFMQLGGRKKASFEKILEKIKEVGLAPRILNHRLGDLSGGQLQRVLVAQAILGDPDLLVLDEPATGIDIVGEETFYDAIHHLKEEHGTTILLVSHDLVTVSNYVDQVICMNKKLMCSGPPSTTLTDRTIAEVFGSNKSLYEHRGHGKTTRGHHSHH